MVWKQDLSKLKQAFREAGGPPPPPVKPKPKPVEVKDLNDEDAMFLAAMGGAPSKPRAIVEPRPVLPRPEPPAADLSFEAGLADLKGIRPMVKAAVLSSQAIPVAPLEAAAPPIEASEPVSSPIEPSMEAPVEPLPGLKGPIRIQLAAGMAVEVDASLDLRNHSVQDALGRLADRIEDGARMGWRTLHVVLGEDASLREAMLRFLAEAPGLRIGRYAQAPIPMGGTQAWVLYY